MPSPLEAYPLIHLGVAASLAAGLATGLGALPIFFPVKITSRTRDAMLGGAAGVMLAATSFSLIVPAIEHAGGGTRGAMAAVVGMLAGAVFLDLMDRYSPHQHFIKGAEGGRDSTLARIWLFVIAITLHNLPEGLAVGVGFGGGDVANGVSLAIGIGLQNIPEGLAVAISLLGEGYSKKGAFFVALMSGLVEPVGGVLGISIVQVMQPVLPFGLAFAAGAMLFVISDEIIPETHRGGHERVATYAVVVGFLIMMFLDNTLG